MNASELLAISQGTKCSGFDECHWCAAPCDRLYPHDDDPILPFVKKTFTAKRPDNGWVCKGCFHFRLHRTTIPYLHGGFKDGKAPRNHSWFITRSGANVVCRNESAEALYPLLLDPPRCFVLALLDDVKINNHIHQAIANEPEELKTDTKLWFTLNNIPHTYTTYELREALKNGKSTGTEPGVQALIRWLGSYTKLAEENNQKREVGRPIKVEPDDGKVTKQVLAMSGGIQGRAVHHTPGPRRR